MSDSVQATNPIATEILRSRLVLQLGLEASLKKSRIALLTLNLSGLLIETREQIMLSRSLAILNAASGSDSLGMQQAERAAGTTRGHALVQLRASALRIQSAIRLQLAVLARSRRKLRVLANMLAGPSMAYSALTVARRHPWPEG